MVRWWGLRCAVKPWRLLFGALCSWSWLASSLSFAWFGWRGDQRPRQLTGGRYLLCEVGSALLGGGVQMTVLVVLFWAALFGCSLWAWVRAIRLRNSR